ncbi:hypothetical protein BGX23_005684 [Mortierella sp. AD031]|nr:hypothetical protein BGX23_005684 [Mortierella sp. AD031]
MTIHYNPYTPLFCALVGVLLALVVVPSAAQIAPAPVFDASYTSINDKALFIRGGDAELRETQYQFYSLDLTPLINGQGKPTWSVLSAQLDANRTFLEMRPLCVTADNTTILHFTDGTVARYSIADNTWSSPELVDPQGNVTFSYSQPAVVDPTTGLVYIPQGRPVNNIDDSEKVLVYDPSSKAVSNLDLFSNSYEMSYDDFAWNAYRGSMMLLGRSFLAGNANATVVWEMTPQAHGGRKLIAYGGYHDEENEKTVGWTKSNKIYILDVATFTWSVGPTAPEGRAYMACASSGDYFVAWGGYTSGVGLLSSKTMYFNFVTNQWIDETWINNDTTTTTVAPTVTPSSPPEPNLNQESPTNNATVIGGVIAGAVALGTIIGILVVRHRRRPRNSSSIDTTSADYPYGKQGMPFTETSDPHTIPTSGYTPNKDPQWNNHNIASSSPVTGQDPQDASQIPVQVYEEPPGPHAYLLNKFNHPQHISPFVSISDQSDSQQQQQQQQHQQRDGLVWSGAPQDTNESAMSPVEDPAEQLALVKAKHEQRLERIQQEREAELQ